jgi:hypothetical protein
MNSTSKIGIAALAMFACLPIAMGTDHAEAHTLKYGRAKRVAQHRADRIAGQPTTITSLFCFVDHECVASADWTRVDPTGCKGCGYDPVSGSYYDTPETDYCSVELKVRFQSPRSRRVVTVVTGRGCF